MKNYKHILAMRDGVIIAADDFANIAAIVNGKAYRTSDYRPIDEEGRQLRADNQYTIQQLIPEAREAYKRLHAATPSSGEDDSRINAITRELQSSELIRSNQEKELASLKKQLAELKAKQPAEAKNHKCFGKCLNWLKKGIPPYLFGPAGTGKSYLAIQLAEALGCKQFEQISGVSDAITDLSGYTDANGNYQSTAFYRVWKNGGMLLIDEMDTSVSQELAKVNNAIANGIYCFPEAAGGMIKRHPECYIIGSGNTIMRGADAEYTGREALDISTCDRFIPVRCHYDREIEMQLSNGNTELVTFIHDYRKAFKAAGISTLASYRAIIKVTVNETMPDMNTAEALLYGLTGVLNSDDVHYIISAYTGNRDNKYFKALSEVVNLLKAEEREDD